MRQRKGLIRTHKVISDYGVSDYYKFYKESRKSDISYSLYSRVLDDILKGIADAMSNQMYDFKLPFNLGRIITRKFAPPLKYDEDGNPFIKRGIDWNGTRLLWAEHPELEKKQYLYHMNDHSSGYTFTIIYRKRGCKFRNRLYYTAQVNRAIKRNIAKKIFSGEFDALETNTK